MYSKFVPYLILSFLSQDTCPYPFVFLYQWLNISILRVRRVRSFQHVTPILNIRIEFCAVGGEGRGEGREGGCTQVKSLELQSVRCAARFFSLKVSTECGMKICTFFIFYIYFFLFLFLFFFFWNLTLQKTQRIYHATHHGKKSFSEKTIENYFKSI